VDEVALVEITDKHHYITVYGGAFFHVGPTLLIFELITIYLSV